MLMTESRRMLETKCVGDNFEMLVSVFAVFVTNILYLIALALGTNNCHRHKVINIHLSPTSMIVSNKTYSFASVLLSLIVFVNTCKISTHHQTNQCCKHQNTAWTTHQPHNQISEFDFKKRFFQIITSEFKRAWNDAFPKYSTPFVRVCCQCRTLMV